MMVFNNALNRISMQVLKPSWYRFLSNTVRADEIQERFLLALLQSNSTSRIGKKYKFGSIKCSADFRSSFPLTNYSFFEPYILDISRGAQNVLTNENVLLFGPTGGTSGGLKLIPYTKSLKNELQQSFNAWIFDIYTHHPDLYKTKSYWSNSPAFPETGINSSNKIPIGFKNGTDYLGTLGTLLQKAFAVPTWIHKFNHIENSRYLTALYLLTAYDLGLISVWNPTVLLMLTSYIDANAQKLIRDLSDGCIRLPEQKETYVLPVQTFEHRTRARDLELIYEKDTKERFELIWPYLQFISCWADGAASSHVNNIRALFPNTFIQPKGLLTTEGIISIPLEDAGGCVCAYNSHFLEFIPHGTEESMLVHELDIGGHYDVAITTGGGLYRYLLDDTIEVIGYFGKTPIIRFEGKKPIFQVVMDKIEKPFVRNCAEMACHYHNVNPAFTMCIPRMNKHNGYYILYIESLHQNQIAKEKIAMTFDQLLRKNPQYDFAREFGQLTPPEIFQIKNSNENGPKQHSRQGNHIRGPNKLFTYKTDTAKNYEKGE